MKHKKACGHGQQAPERFDGRTREAKQTERITEIPRDRSQPHQRAEVTTLDRNDRDQIPHEIYQHCENCGHEAPHDQVTYKDGDWTRCKICDFEVWTPARPSKNYRPWR